MEEIFNYCPPSDVDDERAVFANDVCKLIKITDFNDLKEVISKVEQIRNHFDDSVRNIYELVDNQIPLFGLYELYAYGKDNFFASTEEWESAIKRTIKACEEYYGR